MGGLEVANLRHIHPLRKRVGDVPHHVEYPHVLREMSNDHSSRMDLHGRRSFPYSRKARRLGILAMPDRPLFPKRQSEQSHDLPAGGYTPSHISEGPSPQQVDRVDVLWQREKRSLQRKRPGNVSYPLATDSV